jgi:HNH endonuclease/NUMOD4 motif-containing protein
VTVDHPTIEFSDEELASEGWKPIDHFPYWASTLGRICADDGYILRPRVSGGYARVNLYQGHRKPTHFVVHRLVMASFATLPPKMLVNHRDTNRLNNRYDNLELSTPKHNAAHARAAGRMTTGDDHWTRKYPERVLRGDLNPARRRPETRPRGESHGRALLSIEDVQNIRREYQHGVVGYKRLGDKYGVSFATIRLIINGTNWRSLPQPD